MTWVFAGVLAEALAVGAAGSVLGLLGGLAIAELLKGLFDSFGFALPAAGLVVSVGSVVISLAAEATGRGWHLGSRTSVVLPDGTRAGVTVGAIYTARNLAGDIVLPLGLWAPHALQLTLPSRPPSLPSS